MNKYLLSFVPGYIFQITLDWGFGNILLDRDEETDISGYDPFKKITYPAGTVLLNVWFEAGTLEEATEIALMKAKDYEKRLLPN